MKFTNHWVNKVLPATEDSIHLHSRPFIEHVGVRPQYWTSPSQPHPPSIRLWHSERINTALSLLRSPSTTKAWTRARRAARDQITLFITRSLPVCRGGRVSKEADGSLARLCTWCNQGDPDLEKLSVHGSAWSPAPRLASEPLMGFDVFLLDLENCIRGERRGKGGGRRVGLLCFAVVF